MTDLWPRLQVMLADAQRPSRYIDHEFGSQHRDAQDSADDASLVMVYPDTYELGQANQAIRILVNAVNAQPGMYAERSFLPAVEFGSAMRREGLPLFSLESCAPIAEFDVIGITLPHEMAATNVLETLDLAGIPLRAAERGEDDPIILGGGPCTYNPEPFAVFFDAFLIGEGEESIVEALKVVSAGRRAGLSRAEIVASLVGVEGTYVPSLYEELDDEQAAQVGYRLQPKTQDVPQVIVKRMYREFAESSGWEPCIVPYCDLVHDRLNVEILRGCSRGCRFCQAGMTYRPVRERSADNIVASVLEGLKVTGYDEVSLTSLSSTDHSQIREILTRLNHEVEGKGIRVSIPSQRLDAFGVDMARLVAGNKRGGLTFAPEAGTQRLRDVINKNVTEDDLFRALTSAFEEGWRHCKLYFMVGLPTETDDDIKGIASLAQRAYDTAKKVVPENQRSRIRITVAVALFVPKPQTPFQWDGQIPPEEAQRRVNLLRHSIKYRAIEVNWHDPATSLTEAVVSRGGREIADVIQGAFERGSKYDAWTEFFDEDAWSESANAAGVDLKETAQRTFDTEEVLPWQHISSGVNLSFLRSERRRASQGETTPDCTFGKCTACGLCPGLDTEIETQEVRHA